MATQSVAATIPFRPFAVCPPTNMMNPDGFFVVNMGSQIIQTFVLNQSGGSLPNVRVYIEGISDPGIMLDPQVVSVGDVSKGATFSVRFNADFSVAIPGSALVSFIIESDGFTYARIIKKIFVTKVEYHKPSKTYSVLMPQGTMRINFHKAIMGPGTSQCRKGGPFIALPTDLTYKWIPNPPYEGKRGPLPYEDPWWKIALAIVAVLVLAGALLYDYFSDDELDGGVVSVGGTFDEIDGSVSCCNSVETSANSDDDWLLQGLYGASGFIATAAIASDGPDLHYRGQEATPPGVGESTLSESVRLKINYPVAPSPGTRFPIEGSWKYTRKTNASSYEFEAVDKRENPHFLQAYEVKAPAVHDRRTGPLPVCARFQKPDGKYYKGGELYVGGVLVSTYGAVRRFELKDDGIDQDDKADDSWYCGGYRFRRSKPGHEVRADLDLPGDWYLFVFAQKVNVVTDGVDPFDAAQIIGSFLLTTQLKLSFSEPCKLDHDAAIHIV